MRLELKQGLFNFRMKYINKNLEAVLPIFEYTFDGSLLFKNKFLSIIGA